MAGFLYYFPGATDAQARRAIHEVGLAHALDHDRIASCQVREHGPDGGPGVILADHRTIDDVLVRFDREAQSWRSFAGGRAWILWYRERRPGPRDLVREPDQVVAGPALRLGDSQRWTVPLVRTWAEAPDGGPAGWNWALPSTLGIGDDDRWQLGAVVPRFDGICAECLAWWDARLRAIFHRPEEEPEESGAESGESVRVALDEEQFSLERAADLAVSLVALNYRVSRREVALLGLLDSRLIAEVIDAAVDLPLFLGLLKKKAQRLAERSTDAGPPADCQATGPPSAS